MTELPILQFEILARAVVGLALLGGISAAAFVYSRRHRSVIVLLLGFYFAICTLLLPAYFVFLRMEDGPSWIPPVDIRYLVSIAFAQTLNGFVYWTGSAIEFETVVTVAIGGENVTLTAVSACVGRHAVSTEFTEIHRFENIATMHGNRASTILPDGRIARFRLNASRHCPYRVSSTRRLLPDSITLKFGDEWLVWRNESVRVALVDEQAKPGQATIVEVPTRPMANSSISRSRARTIATRDAFAISELAPFLRDVNRAKEILTNSE